MHAGGASECFAGYRAGTIELFHEASFFWQSNPERIAMAEPVAADFLRGTLAQMD
jgi:hypothetical protein